MRNPIDIIRVILTAVREGVIKRFDSTGRTDETFANREFFQQYGMTSFPKAGAEGLVIKKGNVIFLVASDDRRYRVSLAEGEVALYTDEGDKIHLKRGEIDITSIAKVVVTAPEIMVNASTSAKVTSPVIEANASTSAKVTSPIVELGGGSLQKLIDERFILLFNTHFHDGLTGLPYYPLDPSACTTTKTKAS
jgi:phage gp45-like